jgi:hypothetical protein
LDAKTAREIEAIAWRTLRDAGIVEPPVDVEELLAHLKLHRHYYDLADPGFLDRAKHRLLVNGEWLVNLIRKIKLTAALFPDENRIAIDKSLPALKRDWPSFHETAHRILPWHRPYFYGDTAQTLDPDWQEMLESEANHGAGQLMFCGPVFGREAKDLTPSFKAIKALRTRYGKSLVATARRYVVTRRESAIALLVSTPAWCITPDDQDGRVRHFVRSEVFATMFPLLEGDALRMQVDVHARCRSGGPVADFMVPCDDADGTTHELRVETFFNQYYLVSLVVDTGTMTASRFDIHEGL